MEKLTFFNHTECECRRKSDERIEKPPSITTERGKRVATFGNINPFSRFTYKQGIEPQSLTKKFVPTHICVLVLLTLT